MPMRPITERYFVLLVANTTAFCVFPPEKRVSVLSGAPNDLDAAASSQATVREVKTIFVAWRCYGSARRDVPAARWQLRLTLPHSSAN
jgi:hypothetical protein